MVMANPKVHIICGVCGSKDMMKISSIEHEFGDDTGKFKDKYVISLSCENCSTLSDLEEELENNKR